MTENPIEAGHVGIGTDEDGVATLTLLLPENAWEAMSDGNQRVFDMTQLGVGLKIIIGRYALVASAARPDPALH
jgi:hypothetical protein